MITFQRAPTVKPGDPVTSTQLAKLAKAFNDRIRSGLGDPLFRIWYYFYSFFSQVRNPDESGLLWPPRDEFHEAYQGLDPMSGQTWPVTGPGDPEGANLANIGNAFIFGYDAIGLTSEDSRTADVPLSPASTPAEIWELGKQQRGAIDPITGAMAAPALAAAKEFWKIQVSPTSQHGNVYGGFQPTPTWVGGCGDATAGQIETQRYAVKFSSLKTPPEDTITYPGTCPNIVGDCAIYYAPWAYYVYVRDGSLNLVLDRILSTKDWLEGPYSGGSRLKKSWGHHIPRMMAAFAKDFRGSAAQHQGPAYHLQEAFDFQRFFTSQYALAPAFGHQAGEYVETVYPSCKFAAAVRFPAGTNATGDAIGYRTHDGFVLASCFVHATGLCTSGTVLVQDGDTVLGTVALTPADDHTSAKILVLPGTSVASLQCRVGQEFSLDPDGRVDVEFTEILAYKPEMFDAYLLLRLAGTSTNTGIEGRGLEEDTARIIGENYFANGVLTNVHGSPGIPLQAPLGGGTVNTNPVWDAMRRLSRCTRVITRSQFIGYEVQDGKSILYFLRQKSVSGAQIDQFDSIGPSRSSIPSGQIRAGIQYLVTTGRIRYGNQDLDAGSRFTGGQPDYTDLSAPSAPSDVREYDGIRHTAPPTDYTNEWMLAVPLKVYHWSDSSIWKPSAYADYWPWVNRCHFAPYAPLDATLVWHENFGQTPVYSPEAPSGYNYALGSNITTPYYSGSKADFYRSCRIYEPDDEIDSVTAAGLDGGQEVVRMQIKGRLQHCDAAPTFIPRDMSGWDIAALRAEPYRTKENALREYLWHIAQGDVAYNASWKTGDSAIDSRIQTLPDNPYGAVYPHFVLVQLLPQPYEDDNDTQDPTDTRVTMDVMERAEVYLRAMCEGAVDGETTLAVGCAAGATAIYDYSFENLCFSAFGGRWLNVLPAALRSDRPQGFGPMPNVGLYAEIFNQLSAGINLCNRFRVMLPFRLEARTNTCHSSRDMRQDWNRSGGPDACSSSPTHGVIEFGASFGAPPVTVEGSWTVSAGIGQTTQAAVGGCDGTDYSVSIDSQSVDFRYNWIDPDALWAVPEAWRDMLDTASFGWLARVDVQTSYTRAHQVATQAESDKCCVVADCPTAPGFYWDGTNGYAGVVTTQSESYCAWMPAIGSLASEAPPNTDLIYGLNYASAPPIVVCSAGSGILKSVTPILNNAFILTIPLVD